jgi:dienelactone hydrolase
MEQREIEYEHSGLVMKGMAVLPESRSGNLPGVLVGGDWRGRHAFAIGMAERMAKLGYVGFAIDMYGGAKLGANLQENIALMKPLQEDRGLLMGRVNAAHAALKAMPEVDEARTAMMGTCFGGMCALDLARSGADVRCVVSFHGLFHAPPAALCKPITAKVLVLHGFDDPMANPEQGVALGRELNGLGADWQMHNYGGVVHAFTNPGASDKTRGAAYDERAMNRAFRSMQNLFEEVL